MCTGRPHRLLGTKVIESNMSGQSIILYSTTWNPVDPHTYQLLGKHMDLLLSSFHLRSQVNPFSMTMPKDTCKDIV